MARPDFTDALQPHPDANGAKMISKERQRSAIDIDELSTHLFGTTYLQRQQNVLNILKPERILSKDNQANLSRPDRYKLGLARGKRMRQLMDIHGWNEADLLMAEYLVDDLQPYHLHLSLFNSAMREQSSDAQRAYWIPKIESWEIIGAYAQTELGHGSNIRGVELQPVSGGTMLPHGDGGELVSYGPLPFIVRVRDRRTHLPPSSIVVGDIGPKYGYAPIDNAYMLFNNHRIAHNCLLSRYASVDPDTGAYTKPANPTSVYGSLTRGRAVIVMSARLVLMRAVTVAVRYLSIRRQFRDRDSPQSEGPESSVLDYSTVQVRVLPLLAATFALHYSGEAMRELYERTRSTIALDGDRGQLAELHSTSAGLKSLATDLAANGIETCRRAMGGHGFGGGTGLVQLNADYLSKPTVEGDNWMITQQAARYLLNRVEDVGRSPEQESKSRTEANLREYQTRASTPPKITELSDKAIAEAFQWRASFLAFEAHRSHYVQKRSWNSMLIELYKLSRSYAQSMLVSNFYEAMQQNSLSSPHTAAVLRDLYRLFALSTMDTEAREFQKSGAVAGEVLDTLPEQILKLMQSIRPHAVRLVDAFALPDFLLDSALGRYDGTVYEDLFNRAHRLNPLNRVTFNPDYWSDEIVMGSKDGGQILAKQ